MTDDQTLEHLLRCEAPQVLGALVRRFGRFDIAEEATQESLLAASRQWPSEGVPEQPRSWLIRVGYRRMIDTIRAEQSARRREEEYAASAPRVDDPESGALDADDSLHLLLLCCHPILSRASQIALTLRAVGGLTTAEIAHAYGVTEQTMGVRISRAKQQLKKNVARFEFGSADDLPSRVAAVMRVLYLVFNEGYTASSGDRLVRTDLASEAIRLARMLHRLLPHDPEPAGLLALMLLTHARHGSRLAGDGNLVPLADQDRSRWDWHMIAEGSALVEQAWSQRSVGAYQLQAAIAVVHANAATPEETDWAQIAALYLGLEQIEPGGTVMLARVVAVAHAYGENRALALLEQLDREHGLTHQPLTAQRALAVRAHLLERAGDAAAAEADFLAAAELTANDVESRYLRAKASDGSAPADG